MGKTTLAIHISHALVLKGFKVLFVDADPQGSAHDWAAARALQQVKPHITELKGLVEDLNACALRDLNELEPCLTNWERSLNPLVKTMPTFFGWLKPEFQPFENDKDLKKFQQVTLLVEALAEIMKTPVLDSQGNLNPATATIKAKYCALRKI